MSTRRLLQSNNGSNLTIRRAVAVAADLSALGATTFSRADAQSIAAQANASGIWAIVAANVLRDSHYIGGYRTVLLEESRKNYQAASNAFESNSLTNISVGTGVTAPDGSTNARTVTATAPNGTCQRNFGGSPNNICIATMWVKRRTGTGNFEITSPSGSYFAQGAGTSGWVQYTALGTSSTNRWSGIKVVSSGDAFDVWCQDVQDGAFATSPIQTPNGTNTRAVDALSLAGVNITGTLFYHYYNLATSAWLSAVAAYTAGTAIVPTVNRAYYVMAVVEGTRTVAQCKSIIGGVYP